MDEKKTMMCLRDKGDTTSDCDWNNISVKLISWRSALTSVHIVHI